MRLGIRAKQTAGVTIIVGIFVVGLSALYVSQLATSVLGEHERQADLLIEQIRYRAFDVVPEAPDPYVALRDDPAVRSILATSIFGEVITEAAILDANNIVVASPDTSKLG